ncbi:MAG: hypothetical protein RL885_24880 [Planctomycetota bacterium]
MKIPKHLLDAFNVIRDFPGRTTTELAVQLGVDPRGQFKRRLQELLDLGAIAVDERRRCNVTRRRCRTFIVQYPDANSLDHPIIHS